jgi:hypothetical protein
MQGKSKANEEGLARLLSANRLSPWNFLVAHAHMGRQAGRILLFL